MQCTDSLLEDDGMPTCDRRRFLGAIGLGATALLTAGQGSAQEPRRRPNVIFILIDDLGYMDTTPYGGRYYETPGIERLAARSVRFTDAYAASPLCSPTRASILTGKYPARLGITLPAGHLPPLADDHPIMPAQGPPWQKVLTPESRRHLPLDEYTLGEAFRDSGYRTAFIGKWHLGETENFWPDRQGFEVNIGGGGYPGPPSYFSPYRIKSLPDGPPGEHITDRLTDEAIGYIEQHRAEPFFMCLWHYSVHAPYQAKEELIEKYRGRIDPRAQQGNPVMAGMVKTMDDSIGRLLDKLDELDLFDDTIIIFFSDNGGNEYDRVGDEQIPPTDNAPLRLGKGSPYEGGVRVPMFVSWPGVTRPGTVCSEVVSSGDFYPTLAEMLDLRLREDQVLDGVSIAPLLRGSQSLDREAIFCHYPHLVAPKTGMLSQPCTWVRKGDYKLIRFYDTSEEFPNALELYNVRQDMGETRNLTAEMPQKVRELDALIDQFLKDTGAIVPVPNPAHDARAIRVLDGWRPSGHTVIFAGAGTLGMKSIGGDPFVMCEDMPSAQGALKARFRLKSDSNGLGQFFYADGKTPEFGPTVRLDFHPVHDGSWHEYEVPFATTGALRKIRIDPCAAPGNLELDWVEIADEAGTVLKRWDFAQTRKGR